MKGNEALAEAAIKAGCRHFFGYPITPQTEISAYLSKRMPKIGGTFLQAESEIGAINMVLGAASAGVRALTSSSSPGISLKTEGISYIAGSDVPCVIVNVQRGGPGLGSIQPAQSDYWQATKALGHGDFFVLVYAPSTVQEMVDLMFKAYDKADEYRMPALMLMDGVLGQMMEPVVFPEEDKTDLPEKPWATTGHEFKREHNIVNSLYLEPDELEAKVKERFERYDYIKAHEAEAEEYLMEDASKQQNPRDVHGHPGDFHRMYSRLLLHSQFDGAQVALHQVSLLGGNTLADSLLHRLIGRKASLLQELADQNDVGQALEVFVHRQTGCRNIEHLDVVPLTLLGNQSGIQNGNAARYHLIDKFFIGRPVHRNEDFRVGDDGGRNGIVRDAHAAVGCAASHLRAIGGQPGNLLILHQAAVCNNLAGEKDTLTAESSQYHVMCSHYFASSAVLSL